MDEQELTDLLGESLDSSNIPGASVAVLKDGVILAATAGTSDLESGRPVSQQSQFPIASVTKPMVATAIAMLVDRGRLRLEDPIALHAPELRSAAWSEEITIDQLLANTSGVPMRIAWEFGFDDKEDRALARFCETVAVGSLQNPPGQVWSYGNTGWSLLGRAIETTVELPWLDAMRSLLFEPLSMENTGPHRDATDPVVGYESVEGKQTPVIPWASPGLGPGGAVLWSTASDLVRFAHPHVGAEGEFDSESLREPQSSLSIWPWMDNWCRGWAHFGWKGGSVWGWDGVTRGARAQLRIVPSQDGAIALLTNSGRGRALYWSLMPALMEKLYKVEMPGPPKREGAPSDLRFFEGTYSWPDDEIQVMAEANRLVVSRGEHSIGAVASDSSTFLLEIPSPDPLTVTFDGFDSEGRPTMLYWVVWGHPRRGPLPFTG